jgi:glutathione S-transferase
MQARLPVLYSFRRCPYAMRARMAISYSGLTVELREVVLREMPATLLACSPKGTVPVLVLPDGQVLEESRDIIDRVLAANDPDKWQPDHDDVLSAEIKCLVDQNDASFKAALDHYKYAERHPQHPAAYYRSQGEIYLQQLEQRLEQHAWLCGKSMSVADVSIFPFVRQFAFVDKHWFDAAAYPQLQVWLNNFLQSGLFQGVMQKYPQWREGDALTLFPGEHNKAG